MYYTETLVKTETDDDGETESEYKLTGVMVIDDSDYYLEGERSEVSVTVVTISSPRKLSRAVKYSLNFSACSFTKKYGIIYGKRITGKNTQNEC